MVETYLLIAQQLAELRSRSQATPPLLGLLGRFTKARSLIKKLNDAVDKLGKAIEHLEGGVRISRQAEIEGHRREAHEEEKNLRREMGFDSEDETVIPGRCVSGFTLFPSSFLR